MELLAVDRYVWGDKFGFGYGAPASYPDGTPAVYVAFTSGNGVLYVGHTRKLSQRFRTHSRCAVWYDSMAYLIVCWYDETAFSEERKLIAKLKPKYNNREW
jgi:predicted GIY-YIG superfamily endonuclease